MKNNKNRITTLLIIFFIILIIAAGILIYNTIEQYKKEHITEDTKTEIENTEYNEKIYSKQEISENTEIEEQISDLVRELQMSSDIIKHGMGYEGEGHTVNTTEEEKKALSQMYYERRQEIIKKLKELVNDL